MAAGVVTLLTDFGPGSVYVGQMHAVFAREAPGLRVIDLAHDCPFAAIEAAAYILDRSFRHFPEGSVHVAVVDPGVGGGRDVLAVRSQGHLFVAPDNGVLHAVLEDAVIRRVENRAWMSANVSSTFHGRDIMAPVAARLARGEPFEDVGPRADASPFPTGLEAEEGAIEGAVLLEDRFGNLITNVPVAYLRALGWPERDLRVRVGAAFIDDVVRTFTDVSPGVALAYVGSGEHLEIAVNGGRASDVLGLGVGGRVRVEARP